MESQCASFGLKESTVSRIRSVFSRYPQVERVILYGSRAMGRHRNGSDIDFTMEGDELTHAVQLKMKTSWMIFCCYKIDLSVLREIDNAGLLDHIERVGVIFYERNLPAS